MTTFQIQTHGSSGKWSELPDCRKHWADSLPTTLAGAMQVVRSIKESGYGVRLFVEGVLTVDAPWQIQVPS